MTTGLPPICERPECQSTAGCAHRGPHGECVEWQIAPYRSPSNPMQFHYVWLVRNSLGHPLVIFPDELSARRHAARDVGRTVVMVPMKASEE
jgi:hypothetical protein